MEHNQGLSWHGSMGEGITATIWPHSVLQVIPVPNRMHCLIPSRGLTVSPSVFTSLFDKVRSYMTLKVEWILS